MRQTCPARMRSEFEAGLGRTVSIVMNLKPMYLRSSISGSEVLGWDGVGKYETKLGLRLPGMWFGPGWGGWEGHGKKGNLGGRGESEGACARI